MGVRAAVVPALILPQAPVEKTAHNLDLTRRTKLAMMEAAQSMAVTLHGDLMASVQKRVEEESKLVSEPALIHLQQMVEKTALALDRAFQAENAETKSALLMVDIATGINGASAQFLAVEDSGLAAGHAIARNHSMAEKVAQLSDPQFRQRNAVPVNVPGMVVILHGDHTASVQRHVEVEWKFASELAPIHHQVAEERIVRSWGQIPRAENAIIRSVQLMEVTLIGRSGQTVPSHVEEDEKRVIGNAPILYRNMAGKIVQISDHRLRQKTAMKTVVQWMEVTASGDLGATVLLHAERRRARGHAIDCAITQRLRMAVKPVQNSDQTARQ